jgi:hypothetical protein
MNFISVRRVVAGFFACGYATIVCQSCSSAPDSVGGEDNGTSAAGGLRISTAPALGGQSGSGAGGSGGGFTLSTSSTSTNPEGLCGSTTISTNRAPTDVLIVLDRSGSMGESIGGDCYCNGAQGGVAACQAKNNCTDRWSAVKTAIGSTVAGNPHINWGLSFFSASGNCGVSLRPQVLIGPVSGTAIQSLIGSTIPNSYTPTAAAINAATTYLSGVNDDNTRTILLATDGNPNCGVGQQNDADDMPATLKAIDGAYGQGFQVFVVGIGPSASNLGQMAVHGGTTDFYPATSPEQLSEALAKISKIVSATCTFEATQTPPDLSQVWVYVDKNLVAQNPANGWTFGATSSEIVLTGSYCDAMLAGVSEKVEILFGCPGTVPPQIIQ